MNLINIQEQKNILTIFHNSGEFWTPLINVVFCQKNAKNVQKVKNQLLEHELIAEELSGETLVIEISTKTKKNLDKLVESIILQSEILDLKTDYESKAIGIVLESEIDIGRGPVATVIITSGKLK